MILTNSQFLKLKSQPKISQNSSDTIQFLEILMLESFNEALRNNDDNRLDYSHFLLQKSQANTDSLLDSIFSTPKHTSNTFF